MTKALLHTGLSIVVVLVLLTGGLLFLVNTESGTRILWRIMQVVVDDGLDIGTVAGRLRGPLEIRDIDFVSETMQVRVHHVLLDWDLPQLLKGTLQIEELALEDISYTSVGDSGSTKPSSQLQSLKLPFALQARQVSIRSLSVYSTPDASPFRIDAASAVVNATQDWIDIAQLSIDGPTLSVIGNSRLGLSDNFPIAGKIDWQVQPTPLAPVTGSINLRGTLARLIADVNAKPPYPLRAHLVLSNLLADPEYEFEISGQELSLAAISSGWPPALLSGRINGRKTASNDKTTVHTEVTAINVPQLGSITTVADASIGTDELILTDIVIGASDHPVRVNAGGRIDLTDTTPTLDLQTTWHDLRWPLQGEALFTSRLSHLAIQGPLLRPSFVLESEVDGTVQSVLVDATAELDRSSDKLGVRVEAHAHQLRWPFDGKAVIDDASAELQLAGTLPALNGHFQVRLGDHGNAPLINGKCRLDFSVPNRPRMEIDGEWTAMQWPLNTTEAMVRSDSGSFNVVGTTKDLAARFDAKVDDEGQISGTAKQTDDVTELAAAWNRLAWLHWRQPLHSKRGAIQLTGKPNEYRIQLDVELASGNKDGNLSTEGHGDLSSLTLDDIELQLLQGKITGKGKLAWKPDIQTNITLSGRDLNPATWWNEWPGLLNGTLHGEASVIAEQLSVNLLELKADGQLRDYPLQLKSKGKWQADTAIIESLQLQSTHSQLRAQGSVGKTLAVQWQIDSDDLHVLHPQASGAINGSGSFVGSIERPQLKAKLEGRELAYQDNSLKHVSLDTFIDITDQQISRVSAEIENAHVAGFEIQSARLNADGVTTGHKIVLAARSSQGAVDLKINGQFDSLKSRWLFDITDADFDTAELGKWKLLSASNGRFEAGLAELSPACFGSGDTELCLQATKKGQNIQSSIAIDQLPLAMLSKWLPDNVSVEGDIAGDANLEWEGATKLSGELELHTSGGQILVTPEDTESNTPERILVFEPGTANIRLNGGEIILNLDLPLSGEDIIQGRARIAAGDNKWTQRALNAELKTSIADIAFLAPLTPEVGKLAGRLQGDMRIGGSVQSPAYRGQITWTDGVVELLGPGIVIENIDAQLSGNPLAGMDLNASARSGDGQATVAGQLNFAQGDPVADITIQGNDFRVMNTPQARIDASPDLQLSIGKDRIRLLGDIFIPNAQITLREIPQSAIRVSSDQVLIGSTTTAAPAPLVRKLDAQVRTKLGDNVTFSGFGLSGRLAGEVVSSEGDGQATVAEGEIRILDGRYRAYGQNLTIETGRLLFFGAGITKPVLDLRATRQPTPDIRVGVAARGILQKPVFNLFSEPTMNERNQLSYLLLGRPADTASSGERTVLGEAALAIGLKRAGGITDKISQQFGLDNLGVETQAGSTSEQAAFVIGKYLAPRLYVSYGIGLFEPINTLRLQYSIDQHWKLTTESSGKASGGDIIYSVERGQ